MFWMFLEGFELLHTALAFPSTRVHTVQAIFNVFFVSLMAMLIVSSGIVFYGTAYRNEEVDYLLTTPISDARIVMYKFQETTVFSASRRSGSASNASMK